MAEKNMTQAEALEIAAVTMENIDAEVAAILEDMAEKKRAPRKPRVNPEAEAFRAKLMEVLRDAEVPMTNAELTAIFGEKPQKIANNIRVLEKNGAVVRIRADKPSGKDTFKVA